MVVRKVFVGLWLSTVMTACGHSGKLPTLLGGPDSDSKSSEVEQLGDISLDPSVKNSGTGDPGANQGSTPVVVGKDQAMCGGSGDSCYNSTAAMAKGKAVTPSGKQLEYAATGGTLKIWKEVGGNRVLRAHGFDEWAKSLNLNGRGFSGADFVNYATIVGRVCPPNVYIDESNKFSTGNCLYYTTESAQGLNKAGSLQTEAGRIGLEKWSDPSWYVGNVQTCANKGMRLPTLFETNATVTSSYIPFGSPVLGSNQGLPPVDGGITWTATSYDDSGTSRMYYWTWGDAASAHDSFGTENKVRCVLP